MKPDWSTAPGWANYVAMDKDGNWFWYEEKPELLSGVGVWHSDTLYELAFSWKDSLERRPKNESA